MLSALIEASVRGARLKSAVGHFEADQLPIILEETGTKDLCWACPS